MNRDRRKLLALTRLGSSCALTIAAACSWAAQAALPAPAQTESLQLPHDILLPDAIGFWPPAPGWIVLALLMMMLLMISAFYGFRTYRRRAPLRAALRDIKALAQMELDQRSYAAAVSQLLRRVAIHCHGRENVAALQEQNWLNFLEQHADTTTRSAHLFTQGEACVLANIYAPTTPDYDQDKLNACAQRWMKEQFRRRKKDKAINVAPDKVQGMPHV